MGKLNFRTISLLFALAVVSIPAIAQKGKSLNWKKWNTKLDSVRVMSHLTVLTSDSLEGRETGQPGQKKAANYIASVFKKAGLEPGPAGSHFQKYEIYEEAIGPFKANWGGTEMVWGKDMLVFPGTASGTHEIDQYTFIVDTAVVNSPDLAGKNLLVKVTKGAMMGQLKTLNTKLYEKHPASITLVIPKLSGFFLMNGQRFKKGGLVLEQIENQCPVFLMDEGIVSAHLKDTMSIEYHKEWVATSAENVIGVVKGTKYPDEYIVFSAHYDHLGIHNGQMYRGADDDGSGTSSILSMAEIMGQMLKAGTKPERSMVFLAFSGEEKGLLGSNYYSKHPLYPMDQTVCDLNIDMIGRRDKEHAKDANYVYVIGSDKLSSQLDSMVKVTNAEFGINLDYTYNKPDDPNRFYYRSDHYNFAKKNVPVCFFFTGVHEDYHKPTDTIEKIEGKKMANIANYVFRLGLNLASMKNKLVRDRVNDFNND